MRQVFEVFESGEAEPVAQVSIHNTPDPEEAAAKAVNLIIETVGQGHYRAVAVGGPILSRGESTQGVDMTAPAMVL